MTKMFKAESSALLLIDFQVGTSQLIKTQSPELSIRNGVALAKMAKIFDIPVVMTSSVEEQQQGAMSPELREAAPDAFEKRVKRNGIVNAWEDLAFKAAVKGTKRNQLIMAGVTTDICVVYPAISAVQEGYEVQVVIDACGSPFEDSEETARQRMEKEGVILTATNTLMAEIAQDWSTPRSQQLTPILFALLPTIKPVDQKAA